MSAEPPPDAVRQPFEPPKRGRWPWNTAQWQKIRVVANLPRGRFVPMVVLGMGVYLVAFNGVMRLVMGPEHPLNHFGWERARARGTLTPEQLHKEAILRKFDNHYAELMTDAFFWRHTQAGLLEDPTVAEVRF
ncbi:hypothetical protein M3Y99_01145200 [Aphelenchoides fujianensis]|nr:hypothetical protein M3Y99_01145200 [Aphelenchoides fujianensis]